MKRKWRSRRLWRRMKTIRWIWKIAVVVDYPKTAWK